MLLDVKIKRICYTKMCFYLLEHKLEKRYNQCLGAGARASKKVIGSRRRKKKYRQPEPVREIYKNGSKEPGAMPFLKREPEPLKKGTASQHWV